MWSEQKAKKKLGITDWRNMTKDKIIAFASNLHKMDPEVAKKALEQFPNFADMASHMVDHYTDVVTEVLRSNTKGSEVYYQVCIKIIDSLNEQLNDDDITFDEKQCIISEMIDLSDKIKINHKEDREFWWALIGGLGALLAAIVYAFARIFGHFGSDDDDD